MIASINRRRMLCGIAAGSLIGGGAMIGASAVELAEPDPFIPLIQEWFANERAMDTEGDAEDPAFRSVYERSLALDEEIERGRATTAAGALAAIILARHIEQMAGGVDDGLTASLLRNVHGVLSGLCQGSVPPEFEAAMVADLRLAATP